MNISSPRYLGPAMAPGAVYIGSLHDRRAEIICFKGNMLKFPDCSGGETDTESYIEKENLEQPEYASSPRKAKSGKSNA